MKKNFLIGLLSLISITSISLAIREKGRADQLETTSQVALQKVSEISQDLEKARVEADRARHIAQSQTVQMMQALSERNKKP